ncbi:MULTISPECIES: hypothetical protein [Arthrobacter]|uniref:hypothetical protein n=1 Tax=Arthrobacter TaxID=1663 RepID=UPI000A52CCF4|nr:MULTISPECIES: hypothetical protein [unclassified Arthrobacter]
MAPEESTADLCRRTGIKRSTLAQQLVRGKVSVSTVVSAARAYGQDPVVTLSSFEGYQDLAAGRRDPTPEELISQVPYRDILRYLLSRTDADEDHPAAPRVAEYAESIAVRPWFEAVDPGDLRQQLSAATGIAPQNISAQLTAGRLAPRLAIQAARIAGVSLTSGLVVTGVLQPNEGGWPPRGREAALAELSDAELVALARDRLDALGKVLRKREQDEKYNHALLENLG